MIVDLSPGKQAVISRDPRSPDTWLQLLANNGSLGVSLDPEQAMEIGLALFQSGRRAKRG